MTGTSDGVVDGDRSQPSRGKVDYWVVKLDANGNKTWDKAFGGAGSDSIYSHAAQQTTDGGYIVGGSSNSGINGDKTEASRGGFDYWIVKLDAAGNKLWDKTLGGAGWELLTCLQQTADGGYLVGGTSLSLVSGDKTQAPKGDFDYWIVKLDASGNKLWDKTLGGMGRDMLNSLVQTSDGGYMLAGTSDSDAGGDKTAPNKGAPYSYDYWLVKLDGSGNILWDKTIGGHADEILYSHCVQQTTDGGYIVSGISESGIGMDKSQIVKGFSDYWVVKVDASGNKVWDKSLGGTGSEITSSVRQTADGGYLVGGTSIGINGDKTPPAGRGGLDYWLIKLNPNGSKVWDKTVGAQALDRLNSFQQTTDGGFILGGSSPGNIGADKTQNTHGAEDFWVVKLGPQLVGIPENQTRSFSLYPNPTAGYLYLELEEAKPASLAVYNALGQCVLTQPAQPGKNHLNLSKAAKGLYTLKILTGNQLSVQKIVLE